MTDLTAQPITSLAEALIAGETTAAALTDAFLTRIAAHDPDWRCFIMVTAEAARRQAAHSDARRRAGQSLGPLDGIPLAIKDNIAVAGVARTGGIAAWRDPVAPADAFCVARLRAAGAVILGTLNMHEAALGATSDNPWFGRCRNPLHPGFTPGGSSGGSAAALAGALCAGTLGTDTMGSVRIPAAYCGVYGLKPSYGLISTGGVMPLSWTLDHVGPLARSLDDLALLTAVLAGWDPDCADSRMAPAGLQPAGFVPPLPVDLKGRRIGIGDLWDRVSCEPAVIQAFEQAKDRLVRAGAVLVPARLPGLDPGQARRAGLLVSEAEGAVFHADRLTADPEGFSAGLRTLLSYGRNAGSLRLVQAQRRIAEANLAVNRAFVEQGLEALLLPTAPQVAFAHDAPAPANQADFTCLANFTGRPAVSLPLGFSPDGLPCAVQFVGTPFQDSALLSLAMGFERV
jgi:aspartyl-tRNA(Asn)/glutamyl-tRNA(Gln) amidotransferase subunit A